MLLEGDSLGRGMSRVIIRTTPLLAEGLCS